jgi:alpha/beta superfamily hydrolase
MKIPVETKPALWGIAGGAAALAIAGFSWGGWITGGKAEAMAQTRATDAVVLALAPVCVDRFQRAGDAAANLAALKKVDSWSQGEFVEKGGWSTVPGTNTSDRVSAVAKACAVLLTAS